MSFGLRARVRTFKVRVVEGITTNTAAQLPCGCTIFVGIRNANRQVATGSSACSARHMGLMNRANVMLLDSLKKPSDRLLVEVCAEILDRAVRNGE